MLQEAGIEVIEDFMSEECDRLNPVFFHYITTKTPYVVMKYAMTLDGKIATKTGASKWITGEAARAEVQHMRHRYMGIMAGIGTETIYNPQTGVLAALGHGITDVDTGKLLPLSRGSVMAASVKAVKRGASGSPGELRGDFDLTRDLGSRSANTECGIFGVLPEENRPEAVGEAIPVARRTEVRTGKAVILANCRGNEVCAYEIEIEKLYGGSAPTRNLLLRVTDPALIALTGGIVQGMSGSPIVQDGKLVGAVTHVLLDDPQRGYGILAENMLSASGMTAQSAASA